MAEYHVLPRLYRPQFFRDVLGQDAVITALKNALSLDRVAHAYLFSGSRGTGKTTIVRLLAKALQCPLVSDDGEPCNTCTSCKEISQSSSLEVIEIDGASNRGIDDIRTINETVGYATGTSMYKIYIIDEVHMLTKEAFNALLKTLEDPPEKVKFFFATTEPHKIPATIVSRCQRYHLKRIDNQTILSKLRHIAKDMNITVDDDALTAIARKADGGMRDAESLFDQIIAYSDGHITRDSVTSLLGLMPKHVFFDLDRASKEGDPIAAFRVANDLFSQGKNIEHFVSELIDHFRTILLIQCDAHNILTLTPEDEEHYRASATVYSKEHCMDILQDLSSLLTTIQKAPFPHVALEMMLLRIIRSNKQVPLEYLVQKLSDLETRCTTSATNEDSAPSAPPPTQNNTKKQCDYDTIVQFTAAEFNGSVQKMS